MTLGQALHAVLIVVLSLSFSFAVWSQDTTTPQTQATPLAPAPLVDPGLLEFIKVFGFGAMIFFIWWGDYRKIGKLQAQVAQYEKLTANYEEITKECRDTMLLTMDVNAKLTARLEYLIPVTRKGLSES